MNSNLSKVKRYTETINTLRSSLNLDYDLDRKILDILPKLIEARARYWTKGEHGYFTGSYSDGKSGGTPNCSGGMGVISGKNANNSTAVQNVLTNNSGSGIIFTDKQFGKKAGEHCEDWGLDKTSPHGREQLKTIIENIFDNHTEVRIGAYSGQPCDVLFYIKDGNVVVTKQNNEFITILKEGITSDRVKNARKRQV